jgi:quinol monooxygenase YgiN
MFIVTVLFVVKLEYLQQFSSRVHQQAKDSRALEPNCCRFDIASDISDPRRIFLYEIYSHEQAFNEHLASDHFQSFNSETQSWIDSKSVERWSGPWS